MKPYIFLQIDVLNVHNDSRTLPCRYAYSLKIKCYLSDLERKCIEKYLSAFITKNQWCNIPNETSLKLW